MNTLWEQFASPLRSFVAKRAPREIDTDDVVQDVFVRIQTQLPNLREADRVDAWIFQIARNVVADAFRKRTRLAALPEPSPLEGATSSMEDEPTGESELLSCLASMIEQLPTPYREAIELTDLRGLTQAEAASLVGISISGMKSRVQRGREHLRRIIEEVCHVETDVRGRVIECDPRSPHGCGDRLRPSRSSSDSTDMKTPTDPDNVDSNTNEAETTTAQDASTGCCGGAAPKDSGACCAKDAEVKATGGAGCGCNPKTAEATKKGCC